MMRKTSMTLALALTFGATGALAAQQAPAQQPAAGEQHRGHPGAKGERGKGAMRGDRRAPGGMLLRGITLTDAQKAQLAQLRTQKKPTEAQRKEMTAQREELRALRQKGDTAALRAKFAEMRTHMGHQREQHTAAIRGILTSEQQKQFDANIAEAKKRQGERRGR